MATKFLILLACVALSRAALVRREAPTAVQSFQEKAADFQKTFSEQLNAFINSPDTQKANKALKDSSDAVLDQMTKLSTALQGALGDATGKAKEALEQTKANLEKSATELRNAHPELEQKATEFKDKLQAAVTTTMQESQKVAKELAANMEETNKKLEPKVKDAFNDFVKQLEEVQKKVHEAATKQ